MVIDWWMLLLFLIVAGVWAEWRYKQGTIIGVKVGVDAAIKEMDTVPQDEQIMYARLLGVQSCLVNLVKWKILYIESDSASLVGYNGNKWAITQGLINIIAKHV